MRDFSCSVGSDGIREDLLRAIHGAGAFRNFKDTVRRLGVESAWFAFRADALRQIALDWCEENQIVPQCDHRIHAGSPSRGNPCSPQHNSSEHHCEQDLRPQIGRAQSIGKRHTGTFAFGLRISAIRAAITGAV
jgi:hypothetical protein